MKYFNFKALIASSTLLIMSILPLAAQSQSFNEVIANDPSKAGGEYHYYEVPTEPTAQAPKGYKAFYISHYGRHGSRYHTSSSNFDNALEGLKAAEAKGLLSEEGKLLLRQIDTLYNEHLGMFGMLSERGAAEHRGIGERMYKNYPTIFNGKGGRDEVDCVSSYWPRCIISMANCTSSLKEENPSLDFQYITGPKYLDYISMNLDMTDVSKRCGKVIKTLSEGLVPFDRFFGSIFTDASAALKVIEKPERFMQSVFLCGSISPNTISRPDIFSHFTTDELTKEWIIRNDNMYYRYGISAEEGEYVSAIAKPLIEDIVAKADVALKDGSNVAGDLRFGHDVGLLPLVGTLGIKGMETRFESATAHEHWRSFEMIPMGSNLQLIFFKNKKDDVLVKIVYNEKDSAIPAIKGFDGPYYPWSVLREYLVKTANAISDEHIVKDSVGKERNGVAGM